LLHENCSFLLFTRFIFIFNQSEIVVHFDEKVFFGEFVQFINRFDHEIFFMIHGQFSKPSLDYDCSSLHLQNCFEILLVSFSKGKASPYFLNFDCTNYFLYHALTEEVNSLIADSTIPDIVEVDRSDDIIEQRRSTFYLKQLLQGILLFLFKVGLMIFDLKHSFG